MKPEYSPTALPDHRVIFVPAYPAAVPATQSADLPLGHAKFDHLTHFFIGRTEVTNSDFLEFVQSEEGRLWAVESVTKAGSGKVEPPSPRHSLTNEYHLYEWVEESAAETRRFVPASSNLSHPVVWVSWHCAAAFCNWLSVRDGRRAEYAHLAPEGLSSEGPPGYRLPTVPEWWWAAQGGVEAIEFPWEHFPFPVRDDELVDLVRQLPLDERVQDSVLFYRQTVKAEMLHPEKGTAPVMEDSLGPFGTSGMLGNVKEWTENEHPRDPTKRVVMGATAFIGPANFSFSYWNALFPENTNPDLGFRIARSLSEGELEAVAKLTQESR